MKKQKGITLVALVITVIVLLILAGIVLATLAGNDNIIKNAGTAVGDYNIQKEAETAVLNTIDGYLQAHMPSKEIIPSAPITTATEIQSKTTAFVDGTGKNTVVVPGGFKVRTDLGTTVQAGIVIEDSVGNQFVWIPVGEVTKDDGSTTNITFGRHTFNSTTGEAILEQSVEDYEDIVTIGNYFQELPTFREGSYETNNEEGRPLNTTAYNLEQFITKTKANKGYYIARYEGSLASGNSADNYIPSFTSGKSIFETDQIVASKICRNLYNRNTFVAGDLMNSYAHDTALVYIQQCSNDPDYSINSFNYNYANTGSGADDICNISDFGGNFKEFTTENVNITSSYGPYWYIVTGRGR